MKMTKNCGSVCGAMFGLAIAVSVLSVAGSATAQQAENGVSLPLDTRVVPRHVYEERQRAGLTAPPRGYRDVWTDDRLNPHRAEHTLRPAKAPAAYIVPRGFAAVHRDDDRLNPLRGSATPWGEMQTDAIWQRSLPRRLQPVDAGVEIGNIQAPGPTYLGESPAPTTLRVYSGRTGADK